MAVEDVVVAKVRFDPRTGGLTRAVVGRAAVSAAPVRPRLSYLNKLAADTPFLLMNLGAYHHRWYRARSSASSAKR